MQAAIRVENLGKRYKIGRREQAKQTFREALVGLAAAPVRRLRALGEKAGADETIWALRDVSVEVEPGEVVGIIGRNGAGKTTLLKILSRITEPTEGRVELRGRVASLLEVGTGFHPELTGRENIYLNGAILGMKRAEIGRKFDDIVAFAEIEKFLDTPVKRYSSGMYVRLAFAVAAHLEPEILVVDEILAVGDAGFQRKCLGKMRNVASSGRTVLFVSHNMSSVQTLTNRCIWLEQGRVAGIGTTGDMVQQYLGCMKADLSDDVANVERYASHLGRKIRICRITPHHRDGLAFKLGEDLIFEIELESKLQRHGLRFGATITDVSSTAIMTTSSPTVVDTPATGRASYELVISDARLAPGSYSLAVSIGEGGLDEPRHNYDVVRPGPAFAVTSVAPNGAVLFNWCTIYGTIVHPPSAVRVRSLTTASRPAQPKDSPLG